ncbi:hypothetical protein FDI23_gp149 [Serratia phage CHI14]|uniref:Uncharacterized protein n=2 Tax=Winklervirus chi14 TaxID=2560752 RepID=A0A1Z1LYQ0_9CAUD|nr:hypothetical protein FDI23_gp149 [Serratia phage CHI14]ARW57689.1 hypothetical protein [Serratia phage CHI14]ARW57964.1 hypothetical protein [Serratia phage CBH8]UJJ22262.1 hypothetical protein [Erwinia phage Virsaitis27]UYM28917.1 hypothetical protein [Serratia phage vB_SspM_LC53]
MAFVISVLTIGLMVLFGSTWSIACASGLVLWAVLKLLAASLRTLLS